MIQSVADILLIGAGPIGIEMACALKKSGASYRHIEAGNLASTIEWYAPGTSIFSSPERIGIAGYPFSTYPHSKSTREEYLQYLREVAYAEKLAIEFHRKAVSVKAEFGHFKVHIAASPNGVGGRDRVDETNPEITESIIANKLVLAIGNMHIGNPLSIPGEHLPHVSHYFKEPHAYFGSKVIIVGAKNSAAEAAVRLVRSHVDVTVVMRGENFEQSRIKPWVYPEILSFIREGRLQVLGNASLSKISATTVTVKGPTGSQDLQVDKVLLLTGYQQDPSLFKQLGLNLQGAGLTPIIDSETMETDNPGVFVIGTAAVGTERGHVTSYIETSHVHIPKVLKGLGLKASQPLEIRKLRDDETVET